MGAIELEAADNRVDTNMEMSSVVGEIDISQIIISTWKIWTCHDHV